MVTRTEMWRYYEAIMDELSKHTIDVSHEATTDKTTFYFRDCCGGDIVNGALEYINKH